MANAVNGEVEEDGENRGQAEEEMEEGKWMIKALDTVHVSAFLCILFVLNVYAVLFVPVTFSLKAL